MWNTQGNGGVVGGDRPLDGGCSSRWSKSGGGNSVGDPEVGGGGNWLWSVERGLPADFYSSRACRSPLILLRCARQGIVSHSQSVSQWPGLLHLFS